MKAIKPNKNRSAVSVSPLLKYIINTIAVFLMISAVFQTSFAQTINIWESYAIVNVNGSGNPYYDMDAATANTDFEGANLGTLTAGQSLIVIGGQIKTNKCDGGNITGGRLYWKVWPTADGSSGILHYIPLNFFSDDGGFCNGDQTWMGSNGAINILNGLTVSGNYTLEVYAEAYGVPGTVYSNNGGNNYKATFVYCAPTFSELDITACDEYTWTTGTGLTYTENGNYTYLTTTALGCDSTVTLHLQINKGTKSSITDEACESYTWTGPHGDGNTYTASGTYQYLTTNALGCPDTNILVLNISKNTVSTLTVATCNSYTWSAPNGNNVTYTTGGHYVHTTTNYLGCTHEANLYLSFRTIKPATPATISGTAAACPTETYTYTVVQDPNVDYYTWTAPVGSTIKSGQGTNSIVIEFTAGFVSTGSVSVKGTNCKGTSAARLFTVLFGKKPATPGTISGAIDVCPAVFSGTGNIYKINKVANAKSYNWSLSNPANSHIISHMGTGADDTAILVSFDAPFTTGNILVSATGNCGTSSNKLLAVKRNVPPTPTITGNPTPCPNSIEVYHSSEVSASSYTWAIGANNVGTILSGQGTSTITILFKPVFVRATISVATSSVCGSSITARYVVDKDGVCRSGRTTDIASVKNSPLTVSIFPNPSAGEFILALNGENSRGNVYINITNTFGQSVYNTVLNNGNGILSVKAEKALTDGVYMVACMVNGQKTTKRLVISR